MRSRVKLPEGIELPGLDQVDWGSLSHAQGPASDVPALITSITQAESDVRRAAWARLEETLCPNGKTYEASAAAVPFLVALLSAGVMPDKPRVLRFLFELAGDRVDVAQAIGQGSALLRSLADDENGSLATAAWLLLARLLRVDESLVPAVTRLVADARDPMVRADLAYSFRETLDARAQRRLKTLVHDENPAVRFAAALALVMQGEPIEEQGVAAFGAALRDDAEITAWSEGSPWFGRNGAPASEVAVHAIRTAPPSSILELGPVLCDVLEAQRGHGVRRNTLVVALARAVAARQAPALRDRLVRYLEAHPQLFGDGALADELVRVGLPCEGPALLARLGS